MRLRMQNLHKPMPLASGLFFVAQPAIASKEGIMPQRAQVLYALQRIDTQLTKKKRRYRAVQEHLGESQVLQETRAAMEAAQAELSHWRTQLRDRELEAASIAAKIADTEERLYGGRVKNPKELSDLQKEDEYLKRHKTAVEEKELEEMMTVEELTAKAAVCNEQYTVVEAAWRDENADLHAEYEALRQELTTLLAKRKAVVKHASKKDMTEYDTIRRLRKGVAVVVVRDGTCQLCHVEVPQRDLQRAGSTDDIYHCSGCERILYVPEK
jgi:uncharacterized protein